VLIAMRLLTAISKKEAYNLAKTGKSFNINHIPNISDKLIKAIGEYMEKNVGYKSVPTCCVSRIDGEEVSLEKNYEDLSDYIGVAGGSVILELDVNADMCVSINFEDLLEFNSRVKDIEDDELVKYELEEFFDSISLGKIDGLDIITFIPFLDLNKGKCFMLLNEDWDCEDMKLGNLPQIKLEQMEGFK